MHHYKWRHLSPCEGETMAPSLFSIPCPSNFVPYPWSRPLQLHSSYTQLQARIMFLAAVVLLLWSPSQDECTLCCCLHSTFRVTSPVIKAEICDSVMCTVSAFINFDMHLIYCFFSSMEHSSTSKHHLYLVYNTPKILTIIFLLLLIILPPQQSCSPQSSWILSCLLAELDY